MTDNELKKRLKKLGIISCIAIVMIACLSVYTLGSTKAQLSVYDNTESSNTLKAYGINEDEFKQYLSIFGYLVIDELDESQKNINLITNFIDEMCPVYEVQLDDAGNRIYEPNILDNVSKEIQGKSFKRKENFTSDNEKKSPIPYCKNIIDISKNGDKIEVLYELEVVDMQLKDNNKNTQNLKVKAVILNNMEYEYSKYFISSIEKAE